MCTFPPCATCRHPYLEHGADRPGCNHYLRPSRARDLADLWWALRALVSVWARY